MGLDVGSLLKNALLGAGLGGGAGYLTSGDKDGAILGAEVGALGAVAYTLIADYMEPSPQPAPGIVPVQPHPTYPSQAPGSYSSSIARTGLQYMQSSNSLNNAILAGADALNRLAQSGTPQVQGMANNALQAARSAHSAEEQLNIIGSTLQAVAAGP